MLWPLLSWDLLDEIEVRATRRVVDVLALGRFVYGEFLHLRNEFAVCGEGLFELSCCLLRHFICLFSGVVECG